MDGRRKTRSSSRGRQEATTEMLLEVLQELGPVPDELHKKIQAENNLDTLKQWSKLAIKSQSIEEFLGKINR